MLDGLEGKRILMFHKRLQSQGQGMGMSLKKVRTCSLQATVALPVLYVNQITFFILKF